MGWFGLCCCFACFIVNSVGACRFSLLYVFVNGRVLGLYGLLCLLLICVLVCLILGCLYVCIYLLPILHVAVGFGCFVWWLFLAMFIADF